jgi:hypothetical protein
MRKSGRNGHPRVQRYAVNSKHANEFFSLSRGKKAIPPKWAWKESFQFVMAVKNQPGRNIVTASAISGITPGLPVTAAGFSRNSPLK